MNRKLTKFLAALVVAALALSCRSIEVNKVDKAKYDIKDICIVMNPAVIVEDFLPALQALLEQRGIASKVIPKEDASCSYKLVYTANQSWDMAIYLKFASMILYKGAEVVGRATYDSGEGLNKFGSVYEKLKIVTDQLLADFSERSSLSGK